jgi:hypothetical protein
LHELREILPPTIFVFRDAVLPGRAAAWTPDHRIDLHCRVGCVVLGTFLIAEMT